MQRFPAERLARSVRQVIQQEHRRELKTKDAELNMKSAEIGEIQTKLERAEWRLKADPVLVAILDAQEADRHAREQLLRDLIPLREQYPQIPMDDVRPLPMLPELPPLPAQPKSLMHATATDRAVSLPHVTDEPAKALSQRGAAAGHRAEPLPVAADAVARLAPRTGREAADPSDVAYISTEHASGAGPVRVAMIRARTQPVTFRSIIERSALVDDNASVTSEYSVDALAYERTVSFDLHARRV